ncbi:MAG: phasin family protein [Pseudomonadota bacterium]
MVDKPPKLEVPEQMRTFAETSVNQAKKAFDDFISATEDAVGRMEETSNTVQSGARDVNRTVLTFAEENISAAFNLAEQMVKAKDMEEMLALQQAYLKDQMAAFGEQARVVTDKAAKSAADTAKVSKPDL